MSTSSERPVVILGAGINGAALARELVLNRVPVIVVDKADLASGTTAYSSRLIHGGLRYLEHGELSLVFESLAERRRLLELAPQFVRPLELQIPVATRSGGWTPAIRTFLGGHSPAAGRRGIWLIRSGLWMYDQLARDRQLPAHRVLTAGAPGTVPVDTRRYRWLCSYWDAQMPFPERFVVALLEDARRAAREAEVEFTLLTYHQARRDDTRLEILPSAAAGSEPVRVVTPAAVVNATGAWVDHTLRSLDVMATRKIGGTKGTHFLTFHRPLVEALGGRGLYAEAEDGRPVFVLPLGAGVLVGTTDIAFDGDPADAGASEAELDYLLKLVGELLPQVPLSRDEIHLHYTGVRPLPYSADTQTAAITRRHWLAKHLGGPLPLYSLVGGKLTTCRSLAEETAGQVLAALGRKQLADSRRRVIPGGEDYPPNQHTLAAHQRELANRFGWTVAQVAAAWPLLGTQLARVLSTLDAPSGEGLDGTDLPVALSRWMIDHEWVTCLDDLVERRLMLLYHPELSRRCLEQLAQQLVQAGKLPTSAADQQVQASVARLQTRFGRRLNATAADAAAPRGF